MQFKGFERFGIRMQMFYKEFAVWFVTDENPLDGGREKKARIVDFKERHTPRLFQDILINTVPYKQLCFKVFKVQYGNS